MKHHPDKGGDPQKFAEMSHAAEVLTDPDKRKVYDRFGEEGINKGMGSEPEGHDIFDLLSGRSRGGNSGPTTKKCDDVGYQLKVSLEDVYNGKLSKIAIQRDRVCTDCNGKGGSKVAQCGECNGRGIVIKM
jgi:DnaJ family protein A protein 2